MVILWSVRVPGSLYFSGPCVWLPSSRSLKCDLGCWNASHHVHVPDNRKKKGGDGWHSFPSSPTQWLCLHFIGPPCPTRESGKCQFLAGSSLPPNTQLGGRGQRTGRKPAVSAITPFDMFLWANIRLSSCEDQFLKVEFQDQRELHTYIRTNCSPDGPACLHSHWQCTGVPVFSQSCQYGSLLSWLSVW